MYKFIVIEFHVLNVCRVKSCSVCDVTCGCGTWCAFCMVSWTAFLVSILFGLYIFGSLLLICISYMFSVSLVHCIRLGFRLRIFRLYIY